MPFYNVTLEIIFTQYSPEGISNFELLEVLSYARVNPYMLNKLMLIESGLRLFLFKNHFCLLLCYHIAGYKAIFNASLGSVVKNLPANTREVGLIPGSGRYPGAGNGNPL